jgi:hypothetical protein
MIIWLMRSKVLKWRKSSSIIFVSGDNNACMCTAQSIYRLLFVVIIDQSLIMVNIYLSQLLFWVEMAFCLKTK